MAWRKVKQNKIKKSKPWIHWRKVRQNKVKKSKAEMRWRKVKENKVRKSKAEMHWSNKVEVGQSWSCRPPQSHFWKFSDR